MKTSAIAVSILCACASLASEAADDPKQRQDLGAVIALHGKPCGEVVRYEAKGDSDFMATCKDGNRYRVYVKDGRVLVEKQ